MPFVLGVRSVGYTQSVRRFPAKIDGLTGGGGGATTFLGLTDTPAAYAGAALQGVRVNAGATALEFAAIPAGDWLADGSYGAATGTWNLGTQEVNNVGRLLVNTALDDVGRIQLRSDSGAAVDNDESLSLVNKTDATLNNQKWSPALRLVGQGWSTVLGASQECDWRIYNTPVQSTSPIKTELIIDRSIGGGAYLTKFLIDQNGNVICGYTGFLGVGTTPFLGKCHVDQSNPTGQIAALGLDQGDQDETFIDFTGTSNAASTNSIRALQTDINCIRVEVNSVQPKWMNIFDDSIVGANALTRFAQIYVAGGAASLTCATGGTFQLFNLFATNASSAYCTADAANDKITLDRAGYYLVNFQCSFSGTNGSLWTFVARWNGVNQTQCECIRTLGAAGASGSCSFVGIVDATAGGNDLDVYCTAATTGHQMTAEYAQLTATWIGSTEAV